MLIQDVVYQPVTPLGALAAAALVPVIGFISSKLYDGLKTIIPQYDKLPAWVHQLAAPAFGLIFGWVTAATGAELLSDVHGVSAGFFGAVLNALMMAGIKRWEKSRQPVDATVVLEANRKTGVIGTMSAASVARAPRKPRTPRSTAEQPRSPLRDFEERNRPTGPDSVRPGMP